MSFYSRMSALVTRLLTEYGAAVTIERRASTFNAITGTDSAVTLTETETIGVKQKINSETVGGTRVESGDVLYIIDASYAPQMGDKLYIAGDATSDVYPLNADSIEVVAAGFLPMTLSGSDQTATIVIDGAPASNLQYVAFAAGALTGMSDVIAFDSGAKAIEWGPTMPASAGGGAATAAWQLEMNIAAVAFATIVQVKFEQLANGTKSVVVYVGATLAYSDTPASFPSRVGVALDADTSTARVYFDDAILTLSSSTYTPVEAIATIAVYEKTACPAGDSGKVVGATLYTAAADMTGTTYPSGTTDIGGNALTTASAVYPLDETSQAIIDAGNTGRLTLSNGDQTGSLTVPGVGAAEAWAAVPAGWFTATSATLNMLASTGIKVIEFVPVIPAADNIASADQSYSGAIAIYDETTNVLVVDVSIYAQQDGTFIATVTTTGGMTSIPGLATCPALVGIECNTGTGTMRVLFDDVAQVLTDNAFTPTEITIVLNLSLFDTRLAADAGNVVSLTVRTVAADMTGTGYAVGATDVAGAAI